MVQPLPSSSYDLDTLPAAKPFPLPARRPAAPLLLPARRSLEARRRSRAVASLRRVRREQAGIALTVLVLLGALVVMGGRIASGLRASGVRPQVAAATIRVRAGDTLWTVARRHGPAGLDTPQRIEALLRANHLSSASTVLVPGQTLRVPTDR